MNNIVLIESPYRNGDRNRNLRYLSWCEYDAATRGEYPIASHGNCTAYWPEDEKHRLKGFAWRDALRWACDYVVYYTDLGMSESQQLAKLRDSDAGVRCDCRKLPSELFTKFEAGEYPSGSMRRIAFSPVPAKTRSVGDEKTQSEWDLLRSDGWTTYRTCNTTGVCGHPILHESWNDAGILLELEARGYLPSPRNQYKVVHDADMIRIEKDGLFLLLTPVEK